MNRSSDPVQPLPDTKGTRRIAPLAGAVALTLLPLGQAHALLTTPDFTATQQVTINGEYLPPGSFDIVPTSDSYSGNSLGSSSHDFSSVPGIDTGTVSWNNSIDAQGFVRSRSELTLSEENNNPFTSLEVEATNTVSYYDFIKVEDVAPPGSPDAAPFDDPYIIRFKTQLTGNLSSIVNYDNPNNDGASKATYFSNVEYSGRIASTSGDADTPFEIGDTFSEKPSNSFRFGSNVNESDTILVDVFFVDQLFRLDDGVFFGYDYTDFFSIDIDNIDAGSIDISMTNDLGSTAVTTASVYDLNGNLMPFLRPYSETFGFEFAPIEGTVVPPTPAPAPATAWLFGAALLGLGAARRRRA